MTRYVRIKRQASHDWFEPLIPNIQVDESAPKDTGLLDVDGQPLYSLPDEIGFLAERQS